MVLNNHGITIRAIADVAGISFGSCQAIFTNVLGMLRVIAKIVPKLLNFLKILHGHRSGDVDNVQRQSSFTQNGHNW